MSDIRQELGDLTEGAYGIMGKEPPKTRVDLSLLSDLALATYHREVKDALFAAKSATFDAREALAKAEHDRYMTEMTGNASKLQQVMSRLSATQAAATLREQEESSLLRERSAVEAERKRRMQTAEASLIRDRDRKREADRRASILQAASPAQKRSLLDRMKEAVTGAAPARSPADR